MTLEYTNLEQMGYQIQEVFNTMGATCMLKKCSTNDLVDKFEFCLKELKNFTKIKKGVEIMKICLHKDINQAESEEFHFAIEVKKENSLLNFTDYKEKYITENPLSALIGIDTSNQPIIFDLKKSIHTLISGATGMGKTTILNNIIYSLTENNSKSELKLYILDIKKTLFMWNGLPHLENEPVTNDYEAYKVLDEISEIMEERFEILAKKRLTKATDGLFPHIAIVIDELSDLMLAGCAKFIEEKIVHIAQVGRAVNVSLIIATQNPIVKVCTSLIKANCPTRIALKSVSISDSKNILDNKHAYELDGIGSAIIRSADNPVERKFKACFLKEEEIQEFIDNKKFKT